MLISKIISVNTAYQAQTTMILTLWFLLMEKAD